MPQELKPIKRSKQLAPLSREHHNALLFSWKIKQGLANNTAVEVLRKYTLWFWQNHIKPHFYQEEKILLPYMPANHPMALRLTEDHEQVRELILELDDEADKETLVMLCDLAGKHIRFEEREMYGYLEQLLNEEQLNTIFEELEKHPIVCNDDWKEEFWLAKK